MTCLNQRQQFIFFWLLINEDTFHQFDVCYSITISKTFYQLLISFLAQHKTSISTFYITNNSDALCHEFEAAIINSPSIKNLVLDCEGSNKIPEHLIRQISKACQLNGLLLFCNSHKIVTPGSLNQLLNEQSETMEVLAARTQPFEDMEIFFRATWSSINQESISFQRVEKFIIDMAMLQYFMNYGTSFPTVMNAGLQITDTQQFYGLAEKVRRVFPNMKHFKFFSEPVDIQSNEIEELGKIADLVDELYLEGVKLNISISIIQDFVNAKDININFKYDHNYLWSRSFDRIPLRKPDLVLPNLVNLQIVAPEGWITFSEYLTFFEHCPNLNVFNMLLRIISGYDKSSFIQILSEKRIGLAIEEFGLFLPDMVLLYDIELLETMIKHWPRLEIINGIHRVTAEKPFETTVLHDIANSLQMEAHNHTCTLDEIRQGCFKTYY